jgi:hypothetical protein
MISRRKPPKKSPAEKTENFLADRFDLPQTQSAKCSQSPEAYETPKHHPMPASGVHVD